MTADVAQTVEVSLWRGREDGRYETFTVPLRQSQTVLDIVTWVQRHADSTLSYRFACRVGVCGSCAMTVNGKARWTCRTHVSVVAENDTLEIGPYKVVLKLPAAWMELPDLPDDPEEDAETVPTEMLEVPRLTDREGWAMRLRVAWQTLLRGRLDERELTGLRTVADVVDAIERQLARNAIASAS